jgi:hypothetical protein
MTIYDRGKITVFVAFALVTASSSAMAEAAGGGQTLGDVINTVGQNFANFPFVLSVVAYLSGLFFAIWGIFKFKAHVDAPQQTPLSDGVKRFLAGGMMLSGPYMYEVLTGTLFAEQDSKISSTSRHANPSGGGMDQMIVDLVTNVAGPMENLLIAFTYIAAIALLLVGVSRLTKTMQDGPRGPAGMGTLMTFLSSGALFSFGDMMGSFSSSLFGDAAVSTYANISTTVISDPEDANRVAAVVEAVMVFIMIVGYIAFIRGWFVLKAFADGNSSVSLAQALTFLFGGALAINLGELVNVLQKTVGVEGITFT